MAIMQFIKDYQTLVGTFLGAFLGILSSMFLWIIKERYEKRKSIKNNRDEIRSLFLAVSRDSEESIIDLKITIPKIKEDFKRNIERNGIYVFVPPKLNRVSIDEGRLAILKQGLDFATEQQIDIAVSSAKKFNGFLSHFENGPSFIFESIIKLLNSGLLQKEQAVAEYKKDIERHLNIFESKISSDMETAQRNMLRPVIVQTNVKKYNSMVYKGIDEELNALADVMLKAIKQDLK